MPICLDKKRNEIIAQGEYYPNFERYGIHSDKIINLVKLERLDRGSPSTYKYDNSDFVHYSWWQVIYSNGYNGSIPVVDIIDIERIED